MNKSLSYEELYIDANKLLKEKDKEIKELKVIIDSCRKRIDELEPNKYV